MVSRSQELQLTGILPYSDMVESSNNKKLEHKNTGKHRESWS